MSNLASAKAAIEAELKHAKQGLSHYQTQIDALEKTLAQLAAIAGSSQASNTPASAPVVKAGKDPKVKPVKAKKTKATKAGKRDTGLPFTGGDFWTDLLSADQKSASEVLDAAIAKLGFTPTAEQSKKLTGRMTFALNALVKAEKIKDSGSRRARRFFKG